MVLLRLVGFLALLIIGVCLAAYLFTRNRRYLTFAGMAFKFGLVFLLAFAAFYLLERLILIV